MKRRYEFDLQLNTLESAEPQDWIDLACKKDIPIPWLDWAVARRLCIRSETDAILNAPVVEVSEGDQIPWDLLATPERLIAVFGSFTGMNKAWFKKVQDKPQLLAARYKAGVSGRGGTEPYFYVFPVMMWLIDPKRKAGTKMSVAAGWRRLKAEFPEIYRQYEDLAPDPIDRG
jgi:hypothetical protein